MLCTSGETTDKRNYVAAINNGSHKKHFWHISVKLWFALMSVVSFLLINQLNNWPVNLTEKFNSSMPPRLKDGLSFRTGAAIQRLTVLQCVGETEKVEAISVYKCAVPRT